ncbi:MAG: hypothetical protein ACW99U_06445 [Candidatus Thorarchaeota archaeon]|jgi:hypothetical protein
MLAREASLGVQSLFETGPGAGWVAGAIAGISLVTSDRAVDWAWGDFLDEVMLLINKWSDIPAALPGVVPVDSEGKEASVYDALGGFISVSGAPSSDGLFFHVLSSNIEQVTALFQGLDLITTKDGLIIRRRELAKFQRLVPLLGPICEECGGA